MRLFQVAHAGYHRSLNYIESKLLERQKWPGDDFLQIATFSCDFGLKHLFLRVLNFAICTRKWYRVDKINSNVLSTIVLIANDCGYKVFLSKPQKYQTVASTQKK